MMTEWRGWGLRPEGSTVMVLWMPVETGQGCPVGRGVEKSLQPFSCLLVGWVHVSGRHGYWGML